MVLPPPSFVPPPEEQVANPPPAPAITVQTQTPPPAAPVTIAPPPGPVVAAAPGPVNARPAIANAKSCAPRNEDYPPAAIRADATGLTRIRFTIDGQGSLVKAEIVKSAGGSREHRQLDRVALDKLSTCKFTPGADEHGKPVGGTFEFEYLWKLD
jgi:protein TonB